MDHGAAPDLRVLDGVASWCGGLHGAMPLAGALKALAHGLDSDAAAISRHYCRTEERPRTVALVPGTGPAPLTRAYCNDVLGYQFGRARHGSLWFLSEMLDDPNWQASASLRSWIDSGSAQEIAVIPVSVTQRNVDYVEFHFARALPRSAQLEIESLVPMIERSWRGRKPGLVTQLMADERVPLARKPADRARWDTPILGMSNPAALSRAEFRVCLMLSRGLSVKAVSDELGLSENTVRSHLRAIYSKTETTSLPELIYRILSSGTEDSNHAYGQRRA